jgi:alkyl hydroperoxide reductase subunit AhpC
MLRAIPRPGDPAPEFDLSRTRVPGEPPGAGEPRARLADYRGRWLAVVFYPRDFTLLCPTELTGLAARADEFRRNSCEVLGISSDPIEVHRRWVEDPEEEGGVGPLPFPLASDPDGQAGRAYGVFVEEVGAPLRGLFLIDPEGVVQYVVVHAMSVGRRADEILRVLSALRSGGLCPHDWEAGAKVLDPSRVLGPGRVVAHYRIDARLGEGDNAAVFRAQDLRLQRAVALKVFKPGGAEAARGVIAEARAAAALSHPNVCMVFEVDDSEGVPFIAMELLQGRSLESELGIARPLSLGLAESVVRQVAEGLSAAHAAGVVHGDLKPQNIFVGSDGMVKLVDFGLARRVRAEGARAADPGHGLPTGIAGTPRYMAPEQTLGAPASPATDVFALGAIAYEVATGERAFDGPSIVRVFSAIRGVDPAAMAARVPGPLGRIVRLALAPDPARRVITARSIAEFLNWAPGEMSG